jgi:DUF4097 and DUF4098 domain-containing protein YvlB
MLPLLAAVTLLTLQHGETDTTVAVRQGQRLDVNNFGGSVVVKAWSQNAVRVQASSSSRGRIDVSSGGSTVSVSASGRHGPVSVDFEIQAPGWMPISVSGSPSSDVTIEGTQAEVSVETVEGSIDVVGGTGNISLRTVEGDVKLRSAHGHIELNSVEGSIDVQDCGGAISAESVDGDITLAGIESSDVDVNSVDGDIRYDGTIQDAGRYHLTTHDGDVGLAVPERANATITVSTFDGSFEPCFPVTITDTMKHRFTFTIGSGSAHIDLESFDGTISLCRPGRLGHDNR